MRVVVVVVVVVIIIGVFSGVLERGERAHMIALESLPPLLLLPLLLLLQLLSFEF